MQIIETDKSAFIFDPTDSAKVDDPVWTGLGLERVARIFLDTPYGRMIVERWLACVRRHGGFAPQVLVSPLSGSVPDWQRGWQPVGDPQRN